MKWKEMSWNTNIVLQKTTVIEELQDDIADGIANLTNYNNGNKSLRIIEEVNSILRILKCFNFLR